MDMYIEWTDSYCTYRMQYCVHPQENQLKEAALMIPLQGAFDTTES